MKAEALLRVYFDPAEIGLDGYPYVWHKPSPPTVLLHEPPALPAVKDLIREQAGNRCERCGHPYIKGNSANSPRSEWSPCDECCTHGGPIRRENFESGFGKAEAQWRILTVHHLNGVKHDLRWWNLAALCQRCHLTIQGKVHLERPYDREHTEWFKPHAAGYYASLIEDREEPTREWVLERMYDILAGHATQGTLL